MRAGTRGATCAALCAVLAAACRGGETSRGSPGEEPRSPTTAALESGAAVLQAKAPVGAISMYLVGFHPAKDDPSMQMESHHYCNQVTEDVAQCVLFDGNTASARLHGVEFIISAGRYDELPAEERAYWHPHNYEILSDQLRMPGLPAVAERQALARKIDSYGKTWHFWRAGVHGAQADPLPLGPPHLAWSFNRDGEADEAMVRARDERMGFDGAAERKARAGMAASAHPQSGVSTLAGRFPRAQGAPAGVEDRPDPAASSVPVCELRGPVATR
jgi:hypothetical protein